uniref:Napin-like polypeptide (Fragments) n=1 Tax=Brassica oleracea var. alboglabra TaxID=3714 RepID=2SS1_BRAOA|nr:RecName: Full=Napin-like polypeptide; Contains: RecName: Full=Napin-like polypeptide small chain; Contains: RecName: Full=Napin-like polypeptide large chain [Brassica oleracea var. alboglabra]
PAQPFRIKKRQGPFERP